MARGHWHSWSHLISSVIIQVPLPSKPASYVAKTVGPEETAISDTSTEFTTSRLTPSQPHPQLNPIWYELKWTLNMMIVFVKFRQWSCFTMSRLELGNTFYEEYMVCEVMRFVDYVLALAWRSFRVVWAWNWAMCNQKFDEKGEVDMDDNQRGHEPCFLWSALSDDAVMSFCYQLNSGMSWTYNHGIRLWSHVVISNRLTWSR